MAKRIDIDKELEFKKMEKEKYTEAQKLIKGEKVAYKPSRAYKAYFPNGLQTYLNGVVINIIFDGRTYYFTKPVVEWLEKKLDKIASFESDKDERFRNPENYNKKIQG